TLPPVVCRFAARALQPPASLTYSRPPRVSTPIGTDLVARCDRSFGARRLSGKLLLIRAHIDRWTRSPLRQNARGTSVKAALRPHHGLQIIVGLDDLDQPILGRTVTAIGIGMMLLHQKLVLRLHR